jgi:hypothetical protein
MPSQNHIKEAMDTLLKIFENGNLEKVAHAIFRGEDVPADKWSFLNRLLMYCNDTDDARGFNQWKQVGRYIKKGSKAFYILAPMFKKLIDEKTSEEIQILAGFRAVPVFRFEDTDGAPLIKENIKLDIPFEFNGIIQELGLKIDAVRFNGKVYGSYNPGRKEIRLASPEIDIFLHELSHAVDDKLNGLKAGQQKDQEVTAEFSGAVIGYLMGYKVPLGNVKEYIEHYSFDELLTCLGRIEKIVHFVIDRTKAPSFIQHTLSTQCISNTGSVNYGK